MFTRPAMLLLVAPSLAACSAFGYPSPFTPPAPAAAASSASAAITAATPAARTYEVFGVRYTTLGSSEGYHETGLASWYGERFHGRPTASGETYDMHGLTAAHRTLPLPTCVEVTRLDTGRAILVRVNDRGPFAETHARIIDLSYGAALRLDMVAAGTAEVAVRALRSVDCPAPSAGET